MKASSIALFFVSLNMVSKLLINYFILLFYYIYYLFFGGKLVFFDLGKIGCNATVKKKLGLGKYIIIFCT